MRDSQNLSTFAADATPLVRAMTRRLADRLNVPPQDREDLEQELWVHLLLWWREAGPSFRGRRPSAVSEAVASRIRRLTAAASQSRSFQGHRSHRELPSSHWIGAGLTARRSDDAQRLCELRLDVTAVLERLPDDLREPCKRRLDRASAPSGFPSDDPLSPPTAAALRRAFRACGLHEYL